MTWVPTERGHRIRAGGVPKTDQFVRKPAGMWGCPLMPGRPDRFRPVSPAGPPCSRGSPGPAGALLASRPGGCWVRGGLAVRSWRGRRTPCAALWLLPVAAAWPCHQEVGGALAGAGPCCFQSVRPGSRYDTPETWLPSVSGTKLGRMTTRSSEVPSACELPGLTPRATGRS